MLETLSDGAKLLLLNLSINKRTENECIGKVNDTFLYIPGPEYGWDRQSETKNLGNLAESIESLLACGFLRKSEGKRIQGVVKTEVFTVTDSGKAAVPEVEKLLLADIQKKHKEIAGESVQNDEQIKLFNEKKIALEKKVNILQNMCHHPGVKKRFGRDSEHFGPCPYCGFHWGSYSMSGPDD
jgi:hypothetical protein